jgi:hypothetical protein
MVYTSQAEPAALPRRKRRIFPWFFLAIQVIFLTWLITGLAQGTGPSHAQIVSFCGHGAWQGVFKSYHDCVVHGGHGLTAAGDIGKGIAVGLIIGLWVAADFILLATYGVFRLIRR